MSAMNTSKVFGWSAGLMLSLSVMGCANSPYAEAPQWGQSVRHAIRTQILNPEAAQKHPEPPGADGVVMKSAIDRYQNSFDKPPAPVNVMSIGLGGAVGSAGQ